MKLGKTKEEREAEKEELLRLAKAGKLVKQKYAFFPTHCHHTERKVWLEWYNEKVEACYYSGYGHYTVTVNEEIP